MQANGADCSLIKLHIPDPEAPVYLDKKIILHGITPPASAFKNAATSKSSNWFHPVFLYPYDGILGRDFLAGTKTVLDYGRNSIAVFGDLNECHFL